MSKYFDEVFRIMQESFPENEYRSYENQKNLTHKDNYEILTYKDNCNKVIAFMSLWNFQKFIFIEHIAIDSNYRGKGIGTKFLGDFLNNNSEKLIILEVELPENEICKKRIRFYEKLNFKLNLYPYEQLPLEIGYNNVPMYIMSYPRKINQEEFRQIRNNLYQEVYKL